MGRIAKVMVTKINAQSPSSRLSFCTGSTVINLLPFTVSDQRAKISHPSGIKLATKRKFLRMILDRLKAKVF
jgi:hypothetical protein